VLSPLVLKDALVQVARDSDVERVAAAGHDAGEAEVLPHGANDSAAVGEPANSKSNRRSPFDFAQGRLSTPFGRSG